MNYRRIYINIINNAKKQNRKKGSGCYYEMHHILPKAIFPKWKNRKNNLVLLTPREHFICHMMLEKIYPDKNMFYALWILANDGQNKYCIKGSRQYEKLKEKYVKLIRKPVICLETLEIFESNLFAAKKFGVRVSSINRILGKNNTCKGYHFDYYNEKNDYKNNKYYNLGKKQKVQVICLETLEVGDYNYFSKKLNTNISNICSAIKLKSSCIGFHFEHYDCKKKYTKKHKKYICLETLKEYNSKNEIIKEFKTSITNINNILNKTKNNWYHFEIYDYNKKYENNDYFGNSYDKACNKQVICLETLEVFNSFKEAAKKNNISSGDISNAVKNKNMCNGYHWDYFDKKIDFSKNPFFKKSQKIVPKKRKILCNTTGEVFDSYSDLKRKLGLDKNTVKKIIENNYKGKEKRVFSFLEKK